MSEHPDIPDVPDPSEPNKRSTIDEKAERARLAKALMEDKAFKWAIIQLRQRWFTELVDKGGGDTDSIRLVAKLNTLEGIAAELQREINDYKMAVRNG